MERDLLTILVLGVAFAVFYAVAQLWGWWLTVSTDVLFVLTSGVTAAFGFLVVMGDRGDVTALTHLRQRLRRVHMGFFLAILLWFAGEFTWLIYEVILGVRIPYPSIADVFYLAGYVPALVSIVGFMTIFRKLVTFSKEIVSILVGLLIIGVTAAFLLYPLSISSSPAFVKVFDLAYPLLDAVLVALVMMRLIAFVGTSIGKPWIWIFSGLLLYSFADILFSWGTLTKWYYSGHPIELMWLYGYLALVLGFNRQRKQFNLVAKPS
ncbi:MAG: hypothetical protein WB661_08990 [Candidatus Bathyarchaeia archaeon]